MNENFKPGDLVKHKEGYDIDGHVEKAIGLVIASSEARGFVMWGSILSTGWFTILERVPT